MEHLLDSLQRKGDDIAIHTTPGPMREPLGEKTVTCEKHGDYISAGARYLGKREVWTRCADCEEERIAGERQQAAQDAADRAKARLEALVQEAAIPARFTTRSLDSFVAETTEQEKALTVCRDFVETFPERLKRGDSLIFLGAPGTGKSHLATAILQAILPEHVGMYVTCAGIIRAVRNTWRDKEGQTETEVLRTLADLPLLVIDEIGVQYGTESEQNILFEVLDRRYRDMKPTILLANLRLKREKDTDPAGLKEILGERVYDRLTETARIVTLQGESYRRKAREAA